MSSTAFLPLSPSEPPRVFGAPILHTENDLLALGIAADGSLWSVEEPGLLRQWSLATRRQISEKPLDEAATVWAFNWACRLLASGSSEVDVWEVSSGEQLTGWPAESWVTALAFQPGAPLLATGHDDGIVRVWDWADRNLLHELRGHQSPISAVAFNWDRTRLATVGEDRLIRLWDVTDGKLVATLEGHTDRIPALAWHPTDHRLFSAGWDTTVRVWNTSTAEPIILLNSHAAQVHALTLSGDGKLLASADSDQSLHLWDTQTYQTLDVLRGTGEVRVVVFSPDDSRGRPIPPLLAFGGQDRVIHLWDSRQGPEARQIDTLLLRTTVAISPEGSRLYGLGGGTDLRGWDVETGQPVLALDGTPLLRSFALSPDGKWLAGTHIESPGSEDRATLALYDAATGRRQVVCDGQKPPITALAFRQDSRVLASAGVQSTDVWLWQVPSGEPLLLIPDAVDDCSVEALAFQPGGTLLAVAGIDYLATGGDDGEVTLWQPEEKRRHLALPGGATAIAWHPDGRHLAVANLRKVVRIWDTQDTRVEGPTPAAVRRELTGHQDTITAIAYSADGRWLATAGEDRTVRLWNATSGEEAGAYELDNQVRALVFSPDGKWLFTGNGNTSCYQIEVEQLLASGGLTRIG
jgi:WD40 repeat protein